MEGGITKSTKIFVNLPVRDLERSKAFFAKLGYSFTRNLPTKGQRAW